MGKESSKIGESVLHERLGVLQFLSEQQQANGMMRVRLTREVDSKLRYSEWEKELLYLLGEDLREVLYLPERFLFRAGGLCGPAGTVEMEFEYYKYVLKSEITCRHHTFLFFEETELWYLLYNLLEAAYLLARSGRTLGDVHPLHILLNDKGRVKLIPLALFPQSASAYQRVVEDPLTDAFLAPQELDPKMIAQGIYPPVSPWKAEIFAIGLTLLMAATLHDSYFLYDRGQLRLNSAKLHQTLQQVTPRYSPYFATTLTRLLQQNPNNRPQAADLFAELNKYEDEILSLRTFEAGKQESAEASIENFLPEGGSQAKETSAVIAGFNSL